MPSVIKKWLACGCIVLAAVPLCGQARGFISLTTVEGDGALNDIKQKISHPPVVRVLDERNNPVKGAKVTFTMPALGPGGAFAGNQRSFTATTAEDGLAHAAEFRPNSEEGRFNIKVTAEFNGLDADSTIAQSNTLAGGASVGAKSSNKALWIILGVAAAAGGGIAVALSSHGSSAPAVAPPTILSTGAIVVGAPR